MNRMLLLSAVVCLGITCVGCGTGEDSVPATGTSVGASPAQPSNPVARTVHEFLDAIRVGDTRTSSSRLTPLALQKINENDMVFAPPASEQASFQLGEVEMFAADKASVDTVWKDVDPDGQPTTEHMTWALKLEGDQWRISGMIAQMGPNQSPVVINFEDPSQLLGGGQSKQPQQTPPQDQGFASPRQATQPTPPAQDPFRR